MRPGCSGLCPSGARQPPSRHGDDTTTLGDLVTDSVTDCPMGQKLLLVSSGSSPVSAVAVYLQGQKACCDIRVLEADASRRWTVASPSLLLKSSLHVSQARARLCGAGWCFGELSSAALCTCPRAIPSVFPWPCLVQAAGRSQWRR